MEFLRRQRGVLCLALAALCLAAGCALGGRAGTPRRGLVFSHALHIGEQKLECINCHPDAARGERPGMPAPDACSVCHDELDAQKPEAARVAALFEGEQFRAVRAVALASEVLFPHARHAAAVADCGACHAEVIAGADTASAASLRMDVCTGCHAARGSASECATCHREVRAERAPPSHAHNWKRRHGAAARAGDEETAGRCALCHAERTCMQCHRSEPPESHNAHWHLRGHGLAASIDRESCAACHEVDSCVRCHRDALPQNHVGGWGAPHDAHCAACHFPLQDNGCSACHADTHSHLSAAPRPGDPVHTSGMNCRQCHGISAPLPHVDAGEDCNACHH